MLHQMGRIVKGLKGERLGAEKIVVDEDGVQGVEAPNGMKNDEVDAMPTGDDETLDTMIETSEKKRSAAASNGAGDDDEDEDMFRLEDKAPSEEELVEKDYNQQMLEQGEKGIIEDDLGKRHNPVKQDVSIPEIKSTDGAAKSEKKKDKKDKKRKRDTDTKEPEHDDAEKEKKKDKKRKRGADADEPENDEAGKERRASKKARKEEKRRLNEERMKVKASSHDTSSGQVQDAKPAPNEAPKEASEKEVKERATVTPQKRARKDKDKSAKPAQAESNTDAPTDDKTPAEPSIKEPAQTKPRPSPASSPSAHDSKHNPSKTSDDGKSRKNNRNRDRQRRRDQSESTDRTSPAADKSDAKPKPIANGNVNGASWSSKEGEKHKLTGSERRKLDKKRRRSSTERGGASTGDLNLSSSAKAGKAAMADTIATKATTSETKDGGSAKKPKDENYLQKRKRGEGESKEERKRRKREKKESESGLSGHKEGKKQRAGSGSS